MRGEDSQLDFAQRTTPFWRTPKRDGFFLTKKDLRDHDPFSFVPSESLAQLRYGFSTSGTTGPATYSFWTQEDWDLKIQTLAGAILKTQGLPQSIVALNCYSINHLAGAIFDGVIKALGGVSIGAGYFMKSAETLAATYKKLGCNTLIVGDGENSHKFSIGARSALEVFKRKSIAVPWWLSSGMLRDEICHLGKSESRRVCTSFYGCSEFGFLAMGCPLDLRTYHLLGGDSLVEKGPPALSSAASRHQILVSRVGKSRPHGGSQFIRYLNGDDAFWDENICPCGQDSPRVHGIDRTFYKLDP